MRRSRAMLAELPTLGQFVVVTAASFGAVGGIVGLIIGLFTYAPTAPFAVLELGLPAALLGAVLGLIVGTGFLAARGRVRRVP